MKKIPMFFSKFFKRQQSYCPVCRADNQGFNPLPTYYHDNAVKHGYIHFGAGEMTPIETYSCAKCGASDRERLCSYWIDQQIGQGVFSLDTKIIHFAPEPGLSSKLRHEWPAGYHTADLAMEGCDYKVDMMEMPFSDEMYDFFICSHVLEHVDDDDSAIAELYRIVKKGGCGILLAPICTDLQHTLEDSSIRDAARRWQHFGQHDHVRLYAHDDYVKKIKRHGFSVQELGQQYFGKYIFRQLGLKLTSILYIVSK